MVAPFLRALPSSTPWLGPGRHQLIGSGARASNSAQDTVKLDYLINSAHRLSFRGTHIPGDSTNPRKQFSRNISIPLVAANRTAALSLTSTISPTLLNEFNSR